ncbi:MAG: hypothetical protein Q4A71_00890 [Actinomycetaceae bacterium]|nr:hypothetical protein [Actinomycetaceae bacterium]
MVVIAGGIGVALVIVFGPRTATAYEAKTWYNSRAAQTALALLLVVGGAKSALPVSGVLLGALSAPLICTDFAVHKLPTKWVYAMAIGVITGIACETPAFVGTFVIAAICTWTVMLLLRLTTGVGMGDVRLAPLTFGWAFVAGALIPALYVSAITAGAVALVILAIRKDPKVHIALGPYLVIGPVVAGVLANY